MANIAVFATTEEVYHTAKRVAGDFSGSFQIYQVDLQNAAHMAIEAEASGCAAIVVRSVLYKLLRSTPALTIPVIRCPWMQAELLEGFFEAKQKTGLEKPHMRFLCFGGETSEIVHFMDFFQRMLKTTVSFAEIDETSPESIRDAVHRAMEQKIDILVASATIYAQVKPYPIMSHCLNGTHAYETIASALRVAEQMVATLESERQRSRDLMSIIHHSFNAVIHIDHEGKALLLNRVAEKDFNLVPETYRGKSIWDLIPQIDPGLIKPVLQGGPDVFGEVIEINQSIYILNIAAVHNEGGFRGAVIHFNELERIQRMEAQAKNELNQKGYTASYHFEDIAGRSEKLREAKYIAAEFSKYDATTLILGESGTGKELFAQGIHNNSARRNRPFIAVNCAALPLSLLESELFGYAEGAFTGAARRGKKGLFEIADTGAIFLDEIAELDLSGQVRLLRALAEKSIRRVGDDCIIPIDVRVIAATNKNLPRLVEEGRFREDLYYRLNVLTLEIPPLRERAGDIRLLADHFFSTYEKKTGKYISLSEEAYRTMEQYPWRGNVRQLKNFCERLVIIARRHEIDGSFIVHQLQSAYGDYEESQEPGLKKSADLFERRQIEELLVRYRGSRAKTSGELGVSKSTLWRKMKKLGIPLD
jgi:transcriptional regulator with PAS, ATPase and Fis domain